LKFASALADGQIIESVLILAFERTTLCVSSQVGCRMGCAFCATGAMGFVRDLTVEEIVWQIYAARFILKHPVGNVVLMGMGEPLDNFDNVVQAVRVMSDQRGLDIAQSHITISTAGHVKGLQKLALAKLPKLCLAVSLNAAHDTLRSRLMPINQKYPLAMLKNALREFPLGKGGVFFIEYVLLAGVNDSPEDAQQLATYLTSLPVRVNVIAYNHSGSGAYAAPGEKRVKQFCKWLAEEKLFVRLRQSRGQKVMAACGQLGASKGNIGSVKQTKGSFSK
jgi:23S rRNA (adenine2503-C2)-methyltransferase